MNLYESIRKGSASTKTLTESQRAFKLGDTVYWVGAGNEISATGVIKDFPTEGRMTILWDDGDINTYDTNHPDIQHEDDYDNYFNECNLKLTEGDFFDRFHEVTDKYMSASGEGETMASQIVTAVNKLVYKWYNDGDVYDNTTKSGLLGFANDLSSYANWLSTNIPETSDILNRIFSIGYLETTDYEDLLKDLSATCLTEEFLSTYAETPKKGTIYKCDGPFKWSADNIDEEED